MLNDINFAIEKDRRTDNMAIPNELGNIEIIEKDGVFTIEIGRLDDATHTGLAKVFRLAHESSADVVVITGKTAAP